MPLSPSSRNRAFGDLERAVLHVLWGPEDRPRPAEEWVTVRTVHEALEESREVAYTTVMTVLDRLVGKGLVEREKAGRTNRYRAADSRGGLTAELMRDAITELADTDRRSALVAFVGDASEEDREALRQALAALDARN